MTVLFSDLMLRQELLDAVSAEGYTSPTPIQAQAIPAALQGQNVLGLAQTGTGKTAAFVLPILHRLSQADGKGRDPRALILAPTRELAIQISDAVKAYGAHLRLRRLLIVGGVAQDKQVNDMRRGVDILIATPGRLEDLMEQRIINLNSIETFVLDEADRMLDIGFMPSVRRIAAALPQNRQVLFFSATMPAEVEDLAKSLLKDPVRVEVSPVATPVERIDQQVIHIPGSEKRQVLVDLMSQPDFSRVLVFTRTKHGADRVAKVLVNAGFSTGTMHGRKSQAQRQSVLRAFSIGRVTALVATDIAARGIDVDSVSHVINYELPNEPDTYVHRIGRTARAGKTGIAISLCDGSEKFYLRQIERLTKVTLRPVDRPATSGIVVATNKDLEAMPDKREERMKDYSSRDNGEGRERNYARPKARGGDRPERGDRQDRPQRTERSGDRFDRRERPAAQRSEGYEGQGFNAGRPERSERPAYSGERRERPAFGGERRERPAFGGERRERSSFGGERRGGADRQDRPQRQDGEQRWGRFKSNDRGDRAASTGGFGGERRERPAFGGERREFNRGGEYSGNRFERGDRQDRPQSSTRPAWRDNAAGGEKRGSGEGRKPFGGRPSFKSGGRPQQKAAGGFKGRGNR